MNVQKLLLFCFLSADLCDGHAFVLVFDKHTGDQLDYGLQITSNASIRFLCRNQCQGSDVLISTDQNRHVSGRYSIEYQETSRGEFVTGFISSLETSDSGRYRIGVGRFLVPDQFTDFEIRVTDATTAPAPVTPVKPSTPLNPAAPVTPAATQTSGSPPFSPPPETFSQFSVLFVVGGSVLIGGMLVVVVLLLYKLRKKNQEIRNMESATYENLRRDPIYQTLDLDGNNQDQLYSTL